MLSLLPSLFLTPIPPALGCGCTTWMWGCGSPSIWVTFQPAERKERAKHASTTQRLCETAPITSDFLGQNYMTTAGYREAICPAIFAHFFLWFSDFKTYPLPTFIASFNRTLHKHHTLINNSFIQPIYLKTLIARHGDANL
jgi:hypothetical protein